MSEYISKEAVMPDKCCIGICCAECPFAKKKIPFDPFNPFGECRLEDFITTLPTADVKPVKRGEWIHDAACGVTICSICQWSIEENFYDPTSNEAYPYCPNCGADMREKSEKQ